MIPAVNLAHRHSLMQWNNNYILHLMEYKAFGPRVSKYTKWNLKPKNKNNINCNLSQQLNCPAINSFKSGFFFLIWSIFRMTTIYVREQWTVCDLIYRMNFSHFRCTWKQLEKYNKKSYSKEARKKRSYWICEQEKAGHISNKI